MKYDAENPQQQPESFYRIMLILADTINHFGKKYCFPSQRYMLSVLKKHHGFKLQRRQLNYALKFLEESGQIHRVRRHSRGQTGSLVLKSTLYFIKRKGWKLLNRFRRIIGKPWRKATKPVDRDLVLFDGKPTAIGDVLSGFIQKPEYDTR